MTTLSSDRTKVMKKHLNVALIGNPNSGKTTLFNQLTCSRQYVGNWPGVTVEKKEGKLSYKNEEIKIIDLPGIYSLSPYSSEEINKYRKKPIPHHANNGARQTHRRRTEYDRYFREKRR